MLRETLSEYKHTVIEATDASSGYAVALMQKPDVILCDFLMPGIPGKSIFEELHANPATKKIPRIVMSGLPREKIQSYIPERLWSNILSKPFDYGRLSDFIEQAIEQAKAPPATESPRAESSEPKPSANFLTSLFSKIR